MSKKLTGNGRWESSRIILPEHREAMNRHYMESQKLKRPDLTDEERESIFGMLHAARSNKLEVTITLFGEYGDQQITGYVDKFDPQLRRMKLELENGDFTWIPYEDIIKAEIKDSFLFL